MNGEDLLRTAMSAIDRRGALTAAPRDANEVSRYSFASTEPRQALIAVGVASTFLGLMTVILRFLTVITRHRNVGKDDWSMAVAWVSSIGFAACSFVSVRWGTGFEAVPPAWEVNAIKALYAGELCYVCSVYLLKISIMLLYLRLAEGLHTMLRRGTLVLTVILTVYLISAIVVFGVQCVPIAKVWDPSIPGTCVDITIWFYSNNAFTIITDCAMLALPVPTIWRLHRPKAQRIAIMSVFLVGGLSTISSIIRLYAIRIYTESDNPLRDAAPLNIWSLLEINTGILCSSMPAIKPLFMPTKQTGGSLYYSDTTRCESLEPEKRAGTDLAEITQLKTSNHDMHSKSLPSNLGVSGRGAGAGNHNPDSSCLSPGAARYEAWADRDVQKEEVGIENLTSQQILVQKTYSVRCSHESAMF